MNFLDRIISFDTETIGEKPEYGLQAYRYDGDSTRIRTISYAWMEDGKLRTEAVLDPSDAYMAGMFTAFRDRRWVGWNTCFDVSWFQAAGLDLTGLTFLDAMLLWRHLTVEPEKDKGKRKHYSLAAAMQEFFPEHAGFKEFTNFQTTDPEELKQLLNRNRMDAAFTLKLADMFWQRMSDAQRNAALIEAACIPMISETFNRGITIDVKAAQTLKVSLTQTADDIYADLVKNNPEVAGVDLGSPKQLSDLLFNQWGIAPTKQTAKGANSTDKEALADIADKDPRAKQLRDYREAIGTGTKYVDSPLKSVEYNEDGCTRPQAKIFGTYTGRMTYYSKQGKGRNELPTGIALHQWPRDPRFRELITPPAGYTLLEFDFAGQEFRWMAVMANDITMLALCVPGEDAHAFMGSQATGKEYRWIQEQAGKDKEAKSARYLGKFCNLGMQYRCGAPTATKMAKTQYGLVLEEFFVAGLIRTYKASYSAVPLYWDNQIYDSKIKGYAETLAGRRVQLHGISGWERDSASINYPIQGTGADQKYLALAILKNHLHKYDAHLYFELHDGLFLICPNAKAEKMGHEVKHLLSNLPYKAAWGKTFPIKFPVDCKLSSESWGKLKELKEK